jgi:hypothetical protein
MPLSVLAIGMDFNRQGTLLKEVHRESDHYRTFRKVALFTALTEWLPIWRCVTEIAV